MWQDFERKRIPTTLAIALVLTCSMGTQLTARAQTVEIVGTMATSAAVDSLFARLDEAMNGAVSAADYVTAIALIRAKDALDAWKKTNGDLMDKAFADLDVTTRETFGRMRVLIDQANTGAGDRLKTASEITDQANQLVASLPGGRPYIARFEPRVVPVTAGDSFALRLRGVSLDTANVRMAGITTRQVIGPNEVHFQVPTTLTPGSGSALQAYTMKVSYDQPKRGLAAWLLGQTEEVERQLPIVVMPKTLGTYRIEGTRKYDKRETRVHSANLGQFRGSNTTQSRAAQPPQGWRWDIEDPSKFSVYGTGGRSGRCNPINLHGGSENGFTVSARLDRIGRSLQYPNGAPGRITCHVTGPIYRAVPTTEAIPPIEGQLSWVADKLVNLPADMDQLRITLRSFDGRERVFTGSDTDRFVNVQVAPAVKPSSVVFAPKVPQELLQ